MTSEAKMKAANPKAYCTAVYGTRAYQDKFMILERGTGHPLGKYMQTVRGAWADAWKTHESKKRKEVACK